MIDWLFENRPEGSFPQLAWGGPDKKCWHLAPGNRLTVLNRLRRVIAQCTVRGARQMAFMSQASRQHDQPHCWVCWLGIDIDEDIDLGRIEFALKPWPISLRSSTGGLGVHVLVRLTNPIQCGTHEAGPIIRALTKPLTEALNKVGQPWCKADRRVFWLEGGKNEWISQTEATFDPPPFTPTCHHPGSCPTPTVLANDAYHPQIVAWAQTMGLQVLTPKTQIYIGTVVPALRAAGQTVKTRSTMRGNGELNGFVTLESDMISLWSATDGHVIWSFQILEDL